MGDNWYKCEAAKVLNGTADMKPDQRGIYRTLLDILYDKGGCCAFNPQTLAARNNTTTRHFNRVADYLIEEKKIVIYDGYYFNEKVFLTINSVFMTEKARNYCKFLFPELFKNRGLATPRTKEVRTKEDNTNVLSNAPEKNPPKKRKRKTSWPSDNWRPKPLSPGMHNKLDFTQEDLRNEFTAFKNKSEANGYKYVDWDKAWINWLTHPEYSTWARRNSNALRGGSQSQGLAGAVERSLDKIAQEENQSYRGERGEFETGGDDIPAIFIRHEQKKL